MCQVDNKLSVPDLIRMGIEGKTECVEELLDRYRSYMKSVIKSTLAYKRIYKGEAEQMCADILQEVEFRVVSKMATMDHFRDFGGWVRRIAHNLTIDYLRKQEGQLPSQSVPLVGIPDSNLDPLQELIVSETYRLFEQFKNNLSEKNRTTLRLHLDALSSKKISEKLGVPPGRIRQRMLEIRKQLKAFMEENGLC